MVQLEDGTGTGNKAKVNADFHLLTTAVIETELSHVSKERGQAFVWASGTYDPDAGDTILLLKNTGDKGLHVARIWISADVETRVVVHLPTTEVTPTGTTVTGVNLNTGSSNVAEATAIRDETNNTQGDIVWSGEVQAANDPFPLDLEDALSLAKNKSVGIDFVSAATACDVAIMGHFEE